MSDRYDGDDRDTGDDEVMRLKDALRCANAMIHDQATIITRTMGALHRLDEYGYSRSTVRAVLSEVPEMDWRGK